jgi:hypothetical protein
VSDDRPAIERVGHREFVGGMWDEIGRLQFDFLVEQGLEPHHVLLDVACGALRGGVHFIRYLEPGNYLGLDKNAVLIERGMSEELGPQLAAERRPEFVVSDRFEFERFSKRPDIAIAQSLFTHLTRRDIVSCLRRLHAVANPGLTFYATFFEAERREENPAVSDSRGLFHYTRRQMERFGDRAGWDCRYIGDWNHPRDQRMLVYSL